MQNFEQLFTRLSQRISPENVEFIRGLIRNGDLDENLKIMDNNAFSQMEARGILNIFQDVCNSLGINWRHDNEPEI